MKTVFWQQGEAHGLVWDQGLALVSDEIGVDAATSLWNRCRDGLTMSQFLEALAQISGASLLSLPSFVVALDSGSATHMAARGDMVIELSTAAGTEQLDGVQVTTWLERQVAAVEGIELRSAGIGSPPSRPLQAGLVPAAALRRGRQVGTPAASGTPSEGHRVTEVMARSDSKGPEPSLMLIDPPAAEVLPVTGPSGGDRASLDPQPGIEAVGEHEQPADLHNPEASEATAVPPPSTRTAPETAIWAAPQPQAGGSFLSQTALPGDPPQVTAQQQPERRSGLSDFEMLWGETSAVDIDQAAACLPNPDAAAPKPEMVPDPTEAPLPALSLNQIDDHDSMTILSVDTYAGVPASAASDQPVNAGSVVAILCPLGHANPPHRPGCRICGSPLLGEPQRVPRPPLGWMRTSDGERVELTTPVVIGRKPTVSRLKGLEMPRLVAVPHGHVSSNHVEIRLEGWNVMAVDLHSRNGTLLRRAGEPPVRLPEQPAMLIAGDVVDLGHGVQFSFYELP